MGDRVRRVRAGAVRSRERKPARARCEKDEENHLRCTCCAGGSFGPVLKVYQTLSGSPRPSIRRTTVAPPRPPPPPIYTPPHATEYLMALRTIIALQPSFVFRLSPLVETIRLRVCARSRARSCKLRTVSDRPADPRDIVKAQSV